MAEQRNGSRPGELTPDRCIDFAAGLLNDEERAEVLRLASASPESEDLLRTVLTQAERARSSAAVTERAPVGQSPGSGLVLPFRRFLESLFGTGHLAPAMAGASLLILGLVLGAATMQLFQTDGSDSGTPARLISLFPSATRAAGPAGAVDAGSGLYIELNGVNYPCGTILRFDLTAPSGRTLLRGRIACQPETGEWSGLFLPGSLLTEGGGYRVRLEPDFTHPGDSGGEPLDFRFSIR